jgi:hypothetical protein
MQTPRNESRTAFASGRHLLLYWIKLRRRCLGPSLMLSAVRLLLLRREVLCSDRPQADLQSEDNGRHSWVRQRGLKMPLNRLLSCLEQKRQQQSVHRECRRFQPCDPAPGAPIARHLRVNGRLKHLEARGPRLHQKYRLCPLSHTSPTRTSRIARNSSP